MNQGVPLICYDLFAVSRFFRSAAVVIALQHHTSVEWVTYRDSTVLNAVYTVLFWKEPPGNAQVKSGRPEAIARTTDEWHLRFLTTWIDKLHQGGPAAGNAYVQHVGQLRAMAHQDLNNLYRDVSQINADVINQTQDAIVTLARIRLTATVGVAVIGGVAGVAFALGAAGAAGGVTVLGLEAGASATTFGLGGLGYSMTNSIIKSWEQGPQAKVAAVSLDGGKYAASETGGKVAERVLEGAAAQQARSSQIIRSAEGQIRKYSQRLAEQGLRKAQVRKAQSIIGQSTAQAARESATLSSAARTAKLARGAGASIPVVFAAWDIIDAWGDYQDTMKTVR
jgi:hypothetical protein